MTHPNDSSAVGGIPTHPVHTQPHTLSYTHSHTHSATQLTTHPLHTQPHTLKGLAKDDERGEVWRIPSAVPRIANGHPFPTVAALSVTRGEGGGCVWLQLPVPSSSIFCLQPRIVLNPPPCLPPRSVPGNRRRYVGKNATLPYLAKKRKERDGGRPRIRQMAEENLSWISGD